MSQHLFDNLSPDEKRALLRKMLHTRSEATPKAAAPSNGESIVAVPDRAPLLSPAQERMWFLQKLQPDSAAYHVSEALEFGGGLDIARLSGALHVLVERHPVLRLCLPLEGERPRPVVAAVAADLLPIVDVLFNDLEQRLRDEVRRPFDLERGPLYRFLLLRVDAARQVLLLVFHHLVVDGWSFNILARDLKALYSGPVTAEAEDVPAAPISFWDVVAWQQAHPDREQIPLEFWKAGLAGAPVFLELPTDRPRPAVLTERGALTQRLRFSDPLNDRVRAFCREQRVTPFMTLYAAFAAAVHRWSQQTDFCIGTAVAGRTHKRAEDVVGLFVNTVVLRTRTGAHSRFVDLVQQAKATVLAAYAHQEAPFERVVNALGLQRSLSHSPLFQVMFDLYSAEHPFKSVFEPLPARAIAVDPGGSKFDLTFSVVEIDGAFELYAEYSADLFDAATIDRMVQQYLCLLERALREPSMRVGELPLMTAAEWDATLRLSRGPKTPLPIDCSLHQLFSAQARRTPSALALSGMGRDWTYAELDDHTSRLAETLRRQGVGPETLIALFGDRTDELVGIILGIHKAGGAYLPIDSRLPPARAAQMLSESRSPFAAALSSGEAQCSETLALVPLEYRPQRITWAGAASDTFNSSAATQGSGHLAAVLFTSGSTGIPKGVMIDHAGMLNHVLGLRDLLALTSADVIAQTASVSFDISVWQMLGAFAFGARTHVVADDIARDPVLLAREMERAGVTVAELVPSVMRTMLEEEDLPDFDRLRWMMPTGEALPLSVCRAWFHRFPHVPLINAYGPAECSDDVTLHIMTRAPDRPVVPIGKPVPNLEAYVLDQAMRPVPIGVVGQLFVGGIGVGRGYVRRPELTAERFVPHPFSETPGARLYQTGDLARRGPSGTLEFLSRSDFQIKIRGFRIELADVEAAIESVVGVRAAAAAAWDRPNGQQELVAYYVGQSADAAAIIEQVSARLPSYMVPSRLIQLEQLPLGPNGKLDRKALPTPPAEAIPGADSHFRGITDELIARLFAELLDSPGVDSTSDFFRLGGNSLTATRLVSRLRKAFGVELPLSAVFAHSTVGALAGAVEGLRLGAPRVAPSITHSSSRPPILSFGQQRLWLLHRLQPRSAAYHVVEAIDLQVAPDPDLLDQSLRLLLERHEGLRYAISAHEGAPVVSVRPMPPRALEVIALPPDASDEEVRARLEHAAREPMNVETGPLLRSVLVRRTNGHSALILVVHHIVVDGMSLDLLVRELGTTYSALVRGEAPTLKEESLSSADVAAWERSEDRRILVERDLEYWKNQLADSNELLELPTDRPRPAFLSDQGGLCARHPLPSSTVSLLEAFCREQQVTPFMVLYGAFAVLLRRYTGQDDFCVGTPVSGRTEPALDSVIGLLMNTVVLRTRVGTQTSFSSLMTDVRSTALDAFARQHVPLELIVQRLGVRRSLSHMPLFQALFAWNRVEHSLSEAFEALGAKPLQISTGASKFDLAWVINAQDERYDVEVEYSSELFDARTIGRMVGHFVQLLDEGLRAPSQQVDALALLKHEERKSVLAVSGNAVDRAAPTVVELLDRWALQTPEAAALVTEEGTLTFAEFNRRASQVASVLASRGIGPDSVVAVCLPREAQLVVALWGVLKSGAAYLPLDVAHPPARRVALMRSAGANLLLGRAQDFEGQSLEVPLLDRWDAEGTPQRATPEGIAYVIFTSGSTGEPKGVEVTHRNLSRAFEGFDAEYRTGPGDRWLAATATTFDIHTVELLYPLTRGATVVLRQTGPEGTGRDLLRHGVTHFQSTPSLAAIALEEKGAKDAYQGLKVLVLGGEPLPESLIAQVFSPKGHVLNCYGPTEATVWVTAHPLKPGPVRLGKPIEGATFYVLDRLGALAPIGIPGELYLGGSGVARGYRHRPELTAERFLPDPFSSIPGSRMYRTGDCVRWSDEGELVFLSRVDNQVKIRGVRIELEEVEAELKRIPGVRMAAAVVAGTATSAEKSLVAFVVPALGGLTEKTLKAELEHHLPGYMVPSRLGFVDSLPLGAAGKVNRKALEESARVLLQQSTPGEEPPRDAVEELVAQSFANALHLERVGRHESFFEKGGSSLTAVSVVSRLRQLFGVELPLSTLFAQPTVAALAQQLGPVWRRGDHGGQGPTRRPTDAPLELGRAQERMWFLQKLQPASTAWHVAEAFELEGQLDVQTLEKAVRLLVERHPVLRLSIPAMDGQPHARLTPSPSQVLYVEGKDSTDSIENRLQALLALPFDFETGPLHRFHLLPDGAGRHVLLLAFHHAIIDGISLDLLVRELGNTYFALAGGEVPQFDLSALSFFDITQWLRTEEVEKREAKQLSYWREQLAGMPEYLDFSTDRPRPPQPTGSGGRTARRGMTQELSAALNHLCRQQQVTPFMMLFAGFGAWLRRFSGHADFSIGTPVSGRAHVAMEEAIGLLSNSVAVRLRFDPTATFEQLLRQVRQQLLDALTYQDVPFERVVNELGVSRSLQRSPLYQVMFVMGEAINFPKSRLDPLRSRNLRVEPAGVRFDLVLQVAVEDRGYALEIEYNADVFDRSTADRMLDQLFELYADAVKEPSRSVDQLRLLSRTERDRILALAKTAPAISAPPAVCSDFDEWCRRTPEGIALVTADETLSYLELHRQAEQVANDLAKRGIGTGDLVGICLPRRSELVVAILGVLKSGAAYLPMQPSHPLPRRHALLEAAGAKAIITREAFFPGGSPTAPLIDRVPDEYPTPTEPMPPVEVSPSSTAYTIYTSGSTGAPKAVEVTHDNIASAFTGFDAAHATGPGDRWLAGIAVSFDVHLVEILYPLCRGATVVLRETGSLGAGRDLRNHGITHFQTLPTLLAAALEEEGTFDAIRALKILIIGGEVAPPELLIRLSLLPGRLLNAYGPTETTVCVCAWPVGSGQALRLGRPFPGVEFYVLDTNGAVAPMGIPGELYIGGRTVARGYRNQPELTGERFVPDPFSAIPGARMYRTGDRVKWCEDGTLSFLGRVDNQVKIRGVRVELEEVEAVLARQPGVINAAAIVRRDRGRPTLHAFVTVRGEHEGVEERLREALSHTLPDAMVPGRIAVVDSLPVNATGKLDRGALLSLSVLPASVRPKSEAPQGPMEEAVAQVFIELLGVDALGRDDNFFAAGGHSLAAMQLVSRLSRALAVDLPVSVVFSHPTVRQLSQQIAAARPNTLALRVSRRPNRLPASLGQERLWYALQLSDSAPYVVSTGLLLEGALDSGLLNRAMVEVLSRHEVLRSSLDADRDGVFVTIQAPPTDVLRLQDLSSRNPTDAFEFARERLYWNDWQKFELVRGPLYRAELLRLAPDGSLHALILSFSHTVIDGIGMSILIRALGEAYHRVVSGHHESRAFRREPQYVDYALWQRQREHIEELNVGLESWKQALAHAPSVLDIPLDFPRRAPALNASMRPVAISISPGVAEALRRAARQADVSTYTAVLALTQLWLHRLTGETHVTVASTVSGRILPQTEQMIGHFANVVPFCTAFSAELTLEGLLDRVQAVVEHAVRHQEIPFKQIVDAVLSDLDRVAPPLAQVLLQLENFERPKMPGFTVDELRIPTVFPAYDLVVALGEDLSGGLSGYLAYDSALLLPATGERFARSFVHLFEEALSKPREPVAHLALVGPEDTARLLRQLSGRRDSEAACCVHELFEQQVLRTPNALAVSQGAKNWSYAQLNARANAVARWLVETGTRPEERIAVMFSSAPEALSVLLGILKAGAAYVPLDAGWPIERRRQALELSQVLRVLVETEAAALEHRGLAGQVQVPPVALTVEPETGAGPVYVDARQAAYVVFTSGTTGTPKGVIVEHRSLANHNLAMARQFGLGPGDRMLQFAPLNFDAAAEDLYPPLAVGGTVVMREGLVPAHQLSALIEQERISVISLPPTYIEEWVRWMAERAASVPPVLKLLAPGGDVLKHETYESWRSIGAASIPWLNVYGPTECTITSVTSRIDSPPGADEAPVFPIGRALDNVELYILDNSMQPAIEGLPGRLFIGGAALARGYIGAPDATAERFVPNPFSSEPGARLYNTGDRVRVRPDGQLQFLGRVDFQLKIRGYRVEPVEIEACLRRSAGVTAALVVAYASEGHPLQLCAYVESPNATADARSLRVWVSQHLPSYMVPASFVVLEQLPLTPNGKVDRQALPSPQVSRLEEDEHPDAVYISSLEMVLERIWKEVLSVPRIQPGDNFFELGGDSILAMRLLARVEETLNVTMPLAAIFDAGTLARFAAAIEETLRAGPSSTCVIPMFDVAKPSIAPIVWLPHPGDGEVYHLRFLAAQLQPHFQCYGLQAPETVSNRRFASFEERLEHYVAEMTRVQPQGPYRIAGYSNAGYLAIGLGAALEARGRAIALVALIDAMTQEYIQSSFSPSKDPVISIAQSYMVNDDDLEQVLRELPLEKKWEVVAQRARERRTAPAHIDGTFCARLNHIMNEILVPESARWTPPNLAGRVVLFASSKSTDAAHQPDPTLGWGALLPKSRLEVVTFSGSHLTAVRPPDVAHVAELLLENLRRE